MVTREAFIKVETGLQILIEHQLIWRSYI